MEATDGRNEKDARVPDRGSYHLIRNSRDEMEPLVWDHGAGTVAHDAHSDSPHGG